MSRGQGPRQLVIDEPIRLRDRFGAELFDKSQCQHQNVSYPELLDKC